ncbi:MAG: diguanylate cyclase [Oscillospiraceae bacterium]
MKKSVDEPKNRGQSITMYEQYLEEYQNRWQKRIVKTNFVAATVVLTFEIAYYFILTAIGLRDQTSAEYILLYILLPAGIIYTSCAMGWFIVYRSHQSAEVKSLAAMLAMVALCSTGASVHNIFGATLCSFFVPLSVSVVFGKKRVTNIVGIICVVCELIAMFVASKDLRGNDPYFPLDCLMLFIVFGIAWYATLLMMKNEQEKQVEIKRMWQLESEIAYRKREQEELRLRLEQYQIIMDQTTDILFEWDIRNDVLKFSPNWRKKFGYEAIASEISGRIPLSENIHKEDMPAVVKIIKDTEAGMPYSEAEFRIKNIKGRYTWCRVRATAQFDSAGRAIKAVGVILDINDEKNEKQNLQKLAQRDPLTGIYNKAATNALITRRMRDFDFTVLQALLIVDIDFFKSVNDTYGHMAGDNLISAVAAQLKSRIRGSDVVGRIGGDEFLVYLPEVESEDAALWKAQNLHGALGLLCPEAGAPYITVSIGMAVFPHGTVEFSDLYQYADEALYQRKYNGRDGVSVYDKRSIKSEIIPTESE